MRLLGGRAGVSKLAIPVALIVVLVVAGAYLFLSSGSASSTTATSASTPSVPVHNAVDQFIQDLNARNVDGLTNFYTQNSLVLWSGNTGGLQGQYSGVGNIRLIYATSVGKTSTVSINSSKYAEKVFSPSHINATFMLHMLGNSSTVGRLNATISVSQEWKWGSSGWQISRENWSYDYFDASFLDQGLPSATTFPQWGVVRAGGDPNLVPEKSLEWHAGPFLAMGVYAFLFTIVFVIAAGLVTRRRYP